jgi:predicted enzyme related to lactoylglutathione lyase
MDFTGEILPVFYVSDVRRSVRFYRDVLGFVFRHFWDYDKNEGVTEWKAAQAPIYAEMAAGKQKFGLHLTRELSNPQVCGVIHYFRVGDVDACHAAILERGGDPGELLERPWMRMFSIEDPDGHRLFFFTPPE